MGYIKKLKNNELVGGTDKTTIYPVTSTKAVFEEVTEGDKSSFKSQKTINKEQQDELDDHEGRIQAAEAEDIKSITINGSTKEFRVDDRNNVDLTIYTVDNDPEMPSIASNVEDLRNMVGTSTPVLDTSHKTRIETLEGGESVTGSVENKIKTKVDSINSSYQDDNNEYVKYSMTQVSGEVTDFNIDETSLKNAITSLNTSISGDNIIVGPRPTTGLPGKIYRVINSSNNTYTDYMYSNGSWIQLAIHDTSDDQAQVAYYTCIATGSGAQATKQFVGSGSLTYTPSSGGHIKILMGEANTATGTIYLQYNTDATNTKKPLYYNGEPVSTENTWEAGETIAVYYDPSANSNAGAYFASNAQGGGGKAEKIKYDNSQSGLAAKNVQDAVDEVCENLGDTSLKTGIGYTLVDNTAYEITNGKVTIKTNASQYRRLGPIDVTNFTKVGARFYLLRNYSYVTAFTDSEDNVIGDKLVNTTEGYLEYNVPEGATKLYVCGRKQTSGNVDTANLSVYGKVAQSAEESLDKLKTNTALVGNLSYRRFEPASDNTHDGYFMSNATNGAVWMYSANYTRTHCMIERTDSMKTVVMTRNNEVSAYVAFLKTYTAVTSNLQPMDLCDGFTIKDGTIASTSEHTTKTFIIPDDCNYIVFDCVYQDSSSTRHETPANILIGEAGLGIGLWDYEDIDVHTLTQYEGLISTNENYNNGLPAYLKSTSSATRRHIALPVTEGEKYIVETIGGVNIAFSASNKTNPSNWEDAGAVDSTLYVVKGVRLFEVPTGANYMIIGSSVTTLGDLSARIKSVKKYVKDSLLDMALTKDGAEYYVGASRANHSLIGLFESLKNDTTKKTIYIDAGTYDIFQDYLDNNITPPANGQTSTSDYFDYNSFLPANTKLVGLGKVILEMKPTKQQLLDYADSLSDTTDVNARALMISKVWSPINIGGSCELDNITIETKNVRYCIHDDMHGADVDSVHIYHNVHCMADLPEDIDGTVFGFRHTVGMGWASGSRHEYNDCVFENKNHRCALYGHGTAGKGSTLTFNHCAFIGDTDSDDVVRFQTLGGDVYCKVLMADCYIVGTIYLQLYLGATRNAFDLTVLNCSQVTGSNQKYKIDDANNPYPISEINESLWEYEDINFYALTQYEGFPARNRNYNDGLPIYIPSNNSKVRRHIALEVKEGERYAIELGDRGLNVVFAATNNTNPSSYESVGAVDGTWNVVKGTAFLKVPAGAHYMIIGSSLDTLGDQVWNIKSIRKYKENSLLDVVSKNSTFDILVAASDSDVTDKSKADVVCDGINDAAIITTLMQTYSRKHNIVLASGTFYIHSFSGGGDGTVGVPYVAIPLTESTTIGFTAKIKGVYPAKYGTSYITDTTQDIRGTRFIVTEECYESLDNDKYYAVFGGIDGTYSTWSKYQLVLEDVGIFLPDNKKNIICIDGINLGGMDLYHCVCRGNSFLNRHPTEQQPLQIGVDGCIGVRGHRGACNGLTAKWECCAAFTMGVGFSVCGEHLVLIHPDSIGCKYSYWFNQFPELRNDEGSSDSADTLNGKSWMYPNVLIQPMDEVCANYMRFGINPQKQGLDIIGLNVEHHNETFSSTGNGHLATEDVPGSWAGNISYVIGHNLNNDYPSRPYQYRNMWEYPLFASDGSGKNFNSKNEAHALTGTTATRLTYAANWWQRYWDTDLGKEVICIDPTTSPQTWALADGTIV